MIDFSTEELCEIQFSLRDRIASLKADLVVVADNAEAVSAVNNALSDCQSALEKIK